MYEIKPIEDKNLWNDFVKKYEHINVLSSWEWIEFEKLLGFEVYTFGIWEKDVLKGVFAFRKINAKRGKYLFLRQNINFDWKEKDALFCIKDFLKFKAKEMNCDFVRIAPPLLCSLENEKIFLENNFKLALINSTDAQLTMVLNLRSSIEEISANMRKNTRYMIRRGEKLGIEVLNIDNDEYIGEFEKIYLETVKRNKWNAEDFEYIKKQYEFFASKGLSRMFVAKYEGKVVAVAMFTKFNNQVIYHHSASISEKKDIPAMYVLIWEVIKYYKDLGLGEFNFFGVCKKENSKHSWYGLSLFKRGFGGQERALLTTYDYPVNLIYYKTRFLDKLLS